MWVLCYVFARDSNIGTHKYIGARVRCMSGARTFYCVPRATILNVRFSVYSDCVDIVCLCMHAW